MNEFKIVDEYGCNFDYSYLDKIINKTLEMEGVDSSIFSIVFIDDEKMHELNKTYRGIDRTTDVLSFAFEDNNKLCYNIRQLGEIFVSIPRMQQQAKEYGHSEVRELSFLVVHGLLHLLGYDHTKGEKEEKEMFSKQELVLDEFEETKRS
ncbi:MAG TPA: rRNA maturation RNase YbeY [Candidatus Onthocola stercoravium]|nr:rRNA maturation RNase YbeY [Candidatus Onthocola stercoravium]